MSPKDTGLQGPRETAAPDPAVAAAAGPGRTAPFVLVATRDPGLGARVVHTLAPSYRLRLVSHLDPVVALASELRPELVVMDAGEAGGDNLELCRALRACEVTKATPILVITERSNETAAAFAAGANDCLHVSFHPNELASRAGVHVQLRRLTEELARKERLAALGSLAASVAHNVRNPLTALISGLPALRRRLSPHLDATTTELVEVMVDCAERIERTTHDLLDLSRIDRDSSAAFAPGNGLLACARMFGARLTDPAVVVESDVDAFAMTSGRAGDVNHVFVNVFDNALRAIDGAGRVQVRGGVEDGYYVVRIGDSGPGIDPAALERVFEPFWTTRPAGQGTGLGLAIARRIVEEHGGTIAAGHSALGGAEFTIRLPLRPLERAVA